MRDQKKKFVKDVKSSKTQKYKDAGNRNNSKRKLGNQNIPETALDNTGKDNDPGWYFTNRALAEDVMNSSFNIVQGMQLTGFPNASDATRTSMATIVLSPTPGANVINQQSLQYDYPVMAAARRLYTSMSGYTGRTITYAPQDIAMYILALGEIMSMFSHLRRAIGVVGTYNPQNRAYPSGVLKAMRIDSQDVYEQVNVWRDRYNYLINMANQLFIPNGIAYFAKCSALYDHIYLDSNTPFAQTIMMIPGSTWILDEKSDPNGTMLRAIYPWSDSDASSISNIVWHDPKPLDGFFNVLQKQIEALLNSSTLQIVGSDLLNYARKSSALGFVTLDLLMPGYAVIPQYNANFMLQWHNMVVTGAPCAVHENGTYDGVRITRYNNVYSDASNNSINYYPGFIFGYNSANGSWYDKQLYVGDDFGTQMIDFFTNNPTIEDRIEAARFNPAFNQKSLHFISGSSGTAAGNILTNCGLPDHIINSITFCSVVLDGSIGTNTNIVATTTTTEPVETQSLAEKHMTALSKFSEYPFIYIATINKWIF